MQRPELESSNVLSSAAWFSLLICGFLGPIQSVIWNGTKAPGWCHATPWVGAMLHWQKAQMDISAYYFFGRLFFPIYLGCLLTLWRYRKVSIQSHSLSNTWGFRSLFLAVVIALLGNLTAYWGGGWWGKDVRFVGFWLTEVPALLVALLSFVWCGFSFWRAGAKYLGGGLMLVLPLALLVTGALRYMPHGPAFALCIGCGWLGFFGARIENTLPKISSWVLEEA